MMMLAEPSTLDLNARKALGRAHLNADRIEDALRVYARILKDYPEDVDSYLFLGDCYLAEGDGDTALLLYGEASSLAPGHPEIEHRLRLAHLEQQAQSSAKSLPVPTDTQSVAALLQHLTGRNIPVSEEEVMKAAGLLSEIVHSPHPARLVAERLDEVDALLPALLELNIRQALADGRPDLAQALQNLLNNIHLQMGFRLENGPLAFEDPPARIQQLGVVNVEKASPKRKRLLLWGTEPASYLSGYPPVGALAELGCELTQADSFPLDCPIDFDAVITHEPHRDKKLMEGLGAASAAGIPILLSLAADYEHMPVDHPAYELLGLGSPARARAYATALLLADRVVVPSQDFAKSLRKAGFSAQMIPEGWRNEGEVWSKTARLRHTLNLGWIGLPGQIEEFTLIRRIIIRAMREFPQVRLIIGGDPGVFQLFDGLPETRRLFLPPGSPEDYPHALEQIDILIVPLRNTPFNQSLSDRRLLEAGIRGIPWVASPNPAHLDWEAGGLIANTPDEWHTYLRQLIQDDGLRASLGRAGRQKADTRYARYVGKEWLEVLNQMLPAKRNGVSSKKK